MHLEPHAVTLSVTLLPLTRPLILPVRRPLQHLRQPSPQPLHLPRPCPHLPQHLRHRPLLLVNRILLAQLPRVHLTPRPRAPAPPQHRLALTQAQPQLRDRQVQAAHLAQQLPHLHCLSSVSVPAVDGWL